MEIEAGMTVKYGRPDRDRKGEGSEQVVTARVLEAPKGSRIRVMDLESKGILIRNKRRWVSRRNIREHTPEPE